jgi:hypothetical protein
MNNESSIFQKRVKLINAIKNALLILTFCFPVFVIGNGFDKLGESGLFFGGKIPSHKGGGMEKIGGYVFEENRKLASGIYPVCLPSHLSHECLKFTPAVFDCGDPFSVALPFVEQPTSEKTKNASDDAAENNQRSFPEFICRHKLFFGRCVF